MTEAEVPAGDLVLGVDIGGTGSRAALGALHPRPGARTARGPALEGEGVSVTAAGTSVADLVDRLLDAARERWPRPWGRVRGIGIGATGAATLLEHPAALPAQVRSRHDLPTVLAIDAITAHLGALGGAGGGVVVLGTGAIAISHPGPDGADAARPAPADAPSTGTSGTYPARWHRVDGWGHLLGDRGGGAWLGRAGLETALRHHDGVEGPDAASGAALLAAARERFGDPLTWPGQIYPRPDRAGVLAAFARTVLELAGAGDAAASQLAAAAGTEAARSALAALSGAAAAAAPGTIPRQVVLSGGLTRVDGPLTSAFAETIGAATPEVQVLPCAGDPLDGALQLARLGAEHRLTPQEGSLWM